MPRIPNNNTSGSCPATVSVSHPLEAGRPIITSNDFPVSLKMTAPVILLVDDQPLIRKSLRTILESIDETIVITAVGSLEYAIRQTRASDQAPLLTLLDLQLPDASGTVTLDTYRRQCPGISIVAMTDRAEHAVIHACQQAGVLGLIQKNADTRPIAECLQNALQQAKFSSGAPSGGNSAPPAHAALSVSDQYARISLPNTATHHPQREYRDGRHLGLSERQRSVLRLMMMGLSNKAICRELSLAEGTVKVHVSTVLRILGVSSRAQVTMAAMRSGICFEDIASR